MVDSEDDAKKQDIHTKGTHRAMYILVIATCYSNSISVTR